MPSLKTSDIELSFAELLEQSTLTLASAGPDGEPHAAPVYFAADAQLNLYFFSDPDSQHGVDLARDRRAAAAFYPECESWQEIRGLQLRGQVHPVEEGPDWEYAWEVYAVKFPFVTGLREIVARNQLYVFVPDWIRLVDNRRGFGFKEEWIREKGNEGDGGRTWRRQAIRPGNAGRGS